MKNPLIPLIVSGITLMCMASAAFGQSAEQGANTAPAIKMAVVKGGCFKMGDTFGDGYENEKPVHDVCLLDFGIGVNLVTQAQWKQVMGSNPASFKDCGDDCPVENVSWNEVQEFIVKLNKISDREYRLPTEAEWEYACRSGGKSEKFCGGNVVNSSDLNAIAWYFSNSGDHTNPVGRKRANALGLFDMSGNVWEFVSDWYEEKYSDVPNDPKGPETGTSRVVRGGGWFMLPRNIRAAMRNSVHPGVRTHDLGFRLAMTPK